MQRPTDIANADHATPLLDCLPEVDSAGFGSALLQLAHAAAAQHRMEEASSGVEPWTGLTVLELNTKDKAEHGCEAEARSARDHDRGPVTTEGDR